MSSIPYHDDDDHHARVVQDDDDDPAALRQKAYNMLKQLGDPVDAEEPQHMRYSSYSYQQTSHVSYQHPEHQPLHATTRNNNNYNHPLVQQHYDEWGMAGWMVSCIADACTRTPEAVAYLAKTTGYYDAPIIMDRHHGEEPNIHTNNYDKVAVPNYHGYVGRYQDDPTASSNNHHHNNNNKSSEQPDFATKKERPADRRSSSTKRPFQGQYSGEC